jgi:type IV pilus assembly protein PilE
MKGSLGIGVDCAPRAGQPFGGRARPVVGTPVRRPGEALWSSLSRSGLRGDSVEARKKAGGFTTIELLIVMVVIAILSAIAFPAYTSHIRKGRRAEIQAFMLDMAQREQQYFIDNRGYALDNGGTKGYSTLNLTFPSDLANYYSVTTAARTGVSPSFQITATGLNDQVNDKQASVSIRSLTIDDTNAKAVLDSGGTSHSGVAW